MIQGWLDLTKDWVDSKEVLLILRMSQTTGLHQISWSILWKQVVSELQENCYPRSWEENLPLWCNPYHKGTFKTRKKKCPGYKCSVHENEKFKGWGTICSSLAQGFSLTWWCKKRLLCSLKLYWINLKNNNKKGNFNTNTTDQTNLCHPQHYPYFSFTSWTLMPLERRRFISPMAVSWDISFRLYFVLEVNIDTALI